MQRDCPERQSGCPYFETGCFSDQHHQYYPRTEYTSPLERTFRELPENKEQVCRFEHDLVHQGEDPVKPSREVMQHAVNVAVEIGSLTLSATKRRKIYGNS